MGAAHPAAMEVAGIAAALPEVADPVAVVVAMATVVALAAGTRVVVIIIIHHHLLPLHLATRAGAQVVERAEMIAKRRRRYIAIRKESTNQKS